MDYDLDFLKNFDGSIKLSNVNMSELINAIEANVSQYKYFYKTSIKDFPEIIIEVTNSNIPHLLGLSKEHHHGLSEYKAGTIFDRLKKDWTLDKLKKADESWFDDNKYKIIGVLFLYQIFHVQECKIYSTKHIINQNIGSTLKRDSIYFIVLKLSNNVSYSIELSPIKNNENSYFPRSLKINDSKVYRCEEIFMELDHCERIKTKNKIRMKKLIIFKIF